jgi:endonuclease/exonuclease/phosphatase family metal-dependent hydrolase
MVPCALRILTYNFLAGGSPARNAWKVIVRLRPDILLAQECRCPAAVTSRQSVWAEAFAGRWGTGLFLARGAIRSVEVRGFSGWIAGGELNRRTWLTDRPLRVFSIHCPVGERGYVRTMHALLDALAPLAAGADLVLGGDFNVACGMRAPRDRVRFSSGERALLERMAREFDLMPCWQAMHPRTPLAQTLRWMGNRATPYHCDGIFAPRAWSPRLVRCEVIAGAAWNRLSDHNPVLAVFASG